MAYTRYKIKEKDLQEVGKVKVRHRFLSKEEGWIYYWDFAPILTAKVDDGFIAYCNGECVWGRTQDRAIQSIKNLVQILRPNHENTRGFIYVYLELID